MSKKQVNAKAYFAENLIKIFFKYFLLRLTLFKSKFLLKK